MKQFGLICVVLMISLSQYSCNKKDTSVIEECGDHVITSHDAFVNYPNDDLDIIDVEIDGECLTIKFAAGGCDGETWKVELVAEEAIQKSLPPQRTMRLSLEDKEECEAYITKEVTYDLLSTRYADGKEIILRLEDWKEEIRYIY